MLVVLGRTARTRSDSIIRLRAILLMSSAFVSPEHLQAMVLRAANNRFQMLTALVDYRRMTDGSKKASD